MSDREHTPKWREDFPFESEEDEHITRRDCARFLLLVSGGLAAGTTLVGLRSGRAAEPAPRMEIASLGELAPGSSKPFSYPDERSPALLVRREDGDLVAFSRACPHLSCPVTYERGDDEGERLACHCHHGRFDVATGKGTAGPPRELRPLRRIALAIEGDRVFALGVDAPHAG